MFANLLMLNKAASADLSLPVLNKVNIYIKVTQYICQFLARFVSYVAYVYLSLKESNNVIIGNSGVNILWSGGRLCM